MCAIILMSEMADSEKENIFHKLNLNPPEYNFLFVTPETVLTPTVFELLTPIRNKLRLNEGLLKTNKNHMELQREATGACAR